eukprot:m51a1_g11331 hypothetical protein (374) ;mRNA; f:134374-135741
MIEFSSLSADSDDFPHLRANRVAHALLSASYLALACASVVIAFRRAFCAPQPSSERQARFSHGSSSAVSRAFHAAFASGCIVRAVSFLVGCLRPELDPPMWVAVVQIFPCFFFFCCYLVVLTLWAEAYHWKGERNEKRASVRRFLAGACCVIIAIPCVFAVASLSLALAGSSHRNPRVHYQFRVALQSIAVILYVLMGHGYALYGVLMMRRMFCTPQSTPPHSPHGESRPLLQTPKPQRSPQGACPTIQSAQQPGAQAMMRRVHTRVALMTCLCYGCFCARAAVIVWSVAAVDRHADVSASLWWIDPLYFGLTELLPLVLTLLLLKGPSGTSSSSQPGQAPPSAVSPFCVRSSSRDGLPGTPQWSRRPPALDV